MTGYVENNPQDDYTKQTERQNAGLPCDHCMAFSGHRSWCELIIGSANTFADVHKWENETDILGKPSAVPSLVLNAYDQTLLAEMHISL